MNKAIFRGRGMVGELFAIKVLKKKKSPVIKEQSFNRKVYLFRILEIIMLNNDFVIDYLSTVVQYKQFVKSNW